MKQAKLVVTVYDADGEVVFSKDPADMQTVASCVSLWHDAGTEIYLAFREIEDIDVNTKCHE